jgi:colicin import membrane protein
MKTSGIYSAFTFSIFLHVLIVAATLVIARHSSLYKIPSAYMVTIVDNSAASTSSNQQSEISTQKSDAEVHNSTTEDSKAKTQGMSISSKLKDISKKQDEMAVKERIEALQAKKRIEKMAALRKMVDIGGIKSEVRSQKSEAQTKGSTAGNQTFGGDYYSMVINKIRQQWIFPESIDKDLLAIITIKIARDGSVTIGRIEQSSGNPLFDRSALRAVSKASPLPPPPQEIEIGVRFRP